MKKVQTNCRWCNAPILRSKRTLEKGKGSCKKCMRKHQLEAIAWSGGFRQCSNGGC